MCIALYIATDQKLKLIPWNNENPSLFITDLKERNHHGVEDQFSLMNVFYIGSHEGCGCGFICNEKNSNIFINPEDLLPRSKSVHKLVELLDKILLNSNLIEIFSCYEGHQSDMPKDNGEFTPDKLLEGSFFSDAWDHPQFARILSGKNE